MSKKGRVTSMKEKRDRSPSLSQKPDTGQQWRCPEPPSTLERKKALASTESCKIPIYEKHTVCSIMYAQNNKKQYYSNKSKPSRGSLDKLVTRSIPRPLVKLKNSVDIMEKNVKQMRQPMKDLESKTVVVEKKPRLSNALLLSKDDHNIVTHEEDNFNILTHEEENNTTQMASSGILRTKDHSKQHLDNEDVGVLQNDGGKNGGGDQNMSETNTCSQEYETIDECFNIDHIDCHDDRIHQQDQTDNVMDVASDQLPHPEVDQETQETENEQATQEVDDELGSKDNDLENDETEEVPKEEDPTSKVVAENQHVATNGKKDTAAYKNVIEEAESELRELRRNKVKALVGAFENVISHESHVVPKRSFRINKTITL